MLSLVLNFEGDLQKRGEMLKKAITLCKLGGCVFVSLMSHNCVFHHRIFVIILWDNNIKANRCHISAIIGIHSWYFLQSFYVYLILYFQIMLPLACLENSRYLSSELLDKMMTALGCNLTASENTRKLSFRMYTKTDDAVSSL